ncbi:MAG: ribonuclease HI family protein [Actinobacteria bacterium]|nr:ribonuclease HI family protein [Actinomycetota bacterium]MCG2806756.1 ribonuclease HI family protein [Coriobacteriia bacterium]
MKAVLRTDGGSRGNPGPAGCGFVLETLEGTPISSGGRFLGSVTNNVAEYEALLWGLEVAAAKGVSHLTVLADSELLVRHISGVYKVKHPNMKPLYARACELMRPFTRVEVRHVRREENTVADRLANEAMDARDLVGDAPAPGESGQSTLF